MTRIYDDETPSIGPYSAGAPEMTEGTRAMKGAVAKAEEIAASDPTPYSFEQVSNEEPEAGNADKTIVAILPDSGERWPSSILSAGMFDERGLAA